MVGELELLGIVSDRLPQAGVAFMLTGSFALAPRDDADDLRLHSVTAMLEDMLA